MDDTETRLVKCFQAVFPGITAQQALGASPASVPEWDSVCSVTLLTVIEEEFAASLGADALDGFGSFVEILARIRQVAPK